MSLALDPTPFALGSATLTGARMEALDREDRRLGVLAREDTD